MSEVICTKSKSCSVADKCPHAVYHEPKVCEHGTKGQIPCTEDCASDCMYPEYGKCEKAGKSKTLVDGQALQLTFWAKNCEVVFRLCYGCTEFKEILN